jgi:hypothetical protein
MSRGVLHRGAALLLASLAVACGSETGSATGGGTVAIQITGEELGTAGFPFPPSGEAHLVDGWAITFSHVLVTVGNFTLSSDPDSDPTNQSRTGALVARAAGPWAVDLARDGAAVAEGGEGTAISLAELTSQTENGGEPFATDERYAVSYETLAAEAAAEQVNLDPGAQALYDEMIARGYSVLYAGTATFAGTSCTSSSSKADAYDYSLFPKVVPFELGFAAPTAYVNCQNQANDGDAFPDEEYQRGLAVSANAAATAQITLHLEHAFYSALRHEPPLYFDQIAARLVGKKEGAVVTLDDLRGLDPTALVDGSGKALPFRTCDGTAPPASSQIRFDLGTVPLDPKGDPADALRDYRDFITFVTSTQGHFNGGEGLCYVQRNFPAPRL